MAKPIDKPHGETCIGESFESSHPHVSKSQRRPQVSSSGDERWDMAYFPDLSPYTYFPGESDTFNIGWLDPSEPFPNGETSEEFRQKLERLLSTPEMQTRGFHSCRFCKGKGRVSGSAEIRVR